MQYDSIRNTVVSILKAAPHRSIYLEGPPGGGKTSICYDIAQDLGIEPEKVVIFRPSLRDPVDLNA